MRPPLNIDFSCGDCKKKDAEIERLTAELQKEREANRWIPVGDRLPEFVYGVPCIASETVEVAYRYPGSKQYFRKEVQYWSKYGWVYEWKPIRPLSFEDCGYVIDFWKSKDALPTPPEQEATK